ncbi:hypothetical protein PDENDC454_04274 [Paenibacillus dendritiformis C454]|uniref:Uncharacterized protein n=1 Tax=Paenibacillus dendritiformis C454 TaxID=1131935 RepID=H3SBG9_9BACL|nr:hypothetical protein [Paenibacillus dendritiformis]EHQ63652.1 hypothetical protein PDENDC454_04274 [Paenibacillus dendritiformis C454]
MRDTKKLKEGDILRCISNEGLSSIGDLTVIRGLTANSINTNGSPTGWISREYFRWHCYELVAKEEADKLTEKAKQINPENWMPYINRAQEILKESEANE